MNYTEKVEIFKKLSGENQVPAMRVHSYIDGYKKCECVLIEQVIEVINKKDWTNKKDELIREITYLRHQF